ncbi:hypothetical protein GYA49_02150 [Candidatus Beckwithbacteria bacterium]|nr:hypothetical protein [Candidatus Beckwithbacteria bacterium]
MKLVVFSWLLLIGFCLVLLAQSFRLQVVLGKEQWKRAQQNRFRIVSLEADRGLFFDQTGQALVKTQDGKRTYLYPELFAHVLGYVAEADSKELELFGLDIGKKVGKMGLEREEDGLLRGSDGGLVEEYAADGTKIRSFSKVEPIAGRNLQLNLSITLQKTAYEALTKNNYRGTVIASTPDGKVLAMVSTPSFDPNVLMYGSKQDQSVILNNQDRPLFDRGIAGLYPPGSTFKIVTALGALETGKIDASWEVEDTGEIRVGAFRYGNWYFDQYGQKEGWVNLIKGLQRSNDIYFYKVGEELGADQLASWALKLGFGHKTMIGLDGEERGLVPDPQWKQQAKNEGWYLGDTYITAIGQGNLQVTPIQVQQMMAMVASRGYLCQPKLIAATVDRPKSNFSWQNLQYQACKQAPVSSEHINQVITGLQKACEPGGTGYPLFNFRVKNPNSKIKEDGINFIKEASGSAQMLRIPVACKTGTAETGATNDKGEYVKTHAWFTTFAPVEKPEIVVTVLLEEAGQGSDKAAPIAKAVLTKWFEEVRK